MDTTRRLARYETALENFNMLVAECSAKLGMERSRRVPDATRIKELQLIQARIRDESSALSFDDTAAIEAVILAHSNAIKDRR